MDKILTKNCVVKKAEEIFEWVRGIRRDLHMHPELGMKEYRTSEMICKHLEELGIPYVKNIANTGVVGLIEVDNAIGTVALRADMDALPLLEENDVEYKSTIEGLMHACGHDAHVAIQLGAANVLISMKDKLKVNVKLLFQPAEESVGGALPMIKEGVLKKPDVDIIFGLHTDSEQENGTVSLKYGVSQAFVDTFRIIVLGKGGHGAHPDSTIDTIVIAGYILTAIQSILSRNICATESAVITIGKINGGTKENIIAEKVTMEGTIRSLNSKVRDTVVGRLEKLVSNISESFGGKGKLEFSSEYCALENNNSVLKYIEENAEKYVGVNNIVKYSTPSMGGEDYAFFLKEIPGAFFKIGTKNIEMGIVNVAHNSNFDIDENCLITGVVMQCLNVLNIDEIILHM